MKHALIALPLIAALAGCATDFPKNMPLVFGESITVGIGVGATAADQGADFTLGVKTRDVAVIPVVAYDAAGKPERLEATVSSNTPAEGGTDQAGTTINRDSFSVLGQFGSTTDGSGRRVGLGKFFATGAAAQQLSAGFAKCLANENCGKSQTDGSGK